MSTTTQAHYNSFAVYNNANNHSQFAAQPQRFGANSFSARGPSEPMSRMRGNFSQTSFSMTSRNSPHGSSSTITAQSTSIGRGYGQPPAPGYHRGESNSQSNMAINSRSVKDSRDCDRTPPRNDRDRSSSQVKVDGFTDGKTGTIHTEPFDFKFSKADSSISITNKQTGVTNKVWGDPHYDKQGTFNGALDFKIPGGHLTVDPKAAKNNSKVSYADTATLSMGNKTYTIGNISQESSAPLTVQESRGRSAPHGYTLEATMGAAGFVDPHTGKAPTQADFNRYAA
jgi:hypothetical protein